MITAEKWIDMQENLLIEDICTLVRIPSVSEKTENVEMPFGKNCLEAIKKACEISERMGFQSYNHENYCASMLWKGERKAEIGIFGHPDVVNWHWMERGSFLSGCKGWHYYRTWYFR